MTGTKLFSRLMSAALAFALVVSLLPMAALAESGVAYIDQNGVEQTVATATDVAAGDTSWGTAGTTSWYVVTGSIDIPRTVTVNGHVHLILTDGCSLTVSYGEFYEAGILVVGDGNSLTIYGQAGGTGELTATGDSDCAGIGGGAREYGNCVVTINGGVVTAIGGDVGIGGSYGPGGIPIAGKGGGATVTINGGTVRATGGSTPGSGYRPGIGGGIGGSTSSSSDYGTAGDGGDAMVIINGGVVEATGIGGGTGGSVRKNGTHGLGGTGNVTINGGTVTVAGIIGGGEGGMRRHFTGDSITNTGGTGNVIINGGTVTAAGIGGGTGGNGILDSLGQPMGDIMGDGGDGGDGSVTINGGAVTVTGIIGGGHGGDGAYRDDGNNQGHDGGRGGDGSVTINGGMVTAAGIGGGSGGTGQNFTYQSDGGDGGNGGNGTVTIDGGTVTVNGSIGGGSGGTGGIGRIGYHNGADGTGGTGDVTMEGGTIMTSGIDSAPHNRSNANVYLTTITLEGVTAATAVSSLTADIGYTYGTKDMKTDSGGRLYLYLPESTKTTRASAGGRDYRGEVLTSADAASSQGTLALVPPPAPYIPPADVTLYNANATIWLTGAGLTEGDLLLTPSLTKGEDYNALRKLIDKKDILRVYDISLQSGRSPAGGAMYLTFALGGEYAGLEFTLVHRKADGSFEYFFATADTKGNVRFGPLYGLSPFMLAKGRLLYTPAYEILEVPKTGDSPSLLGLAVLGVACTIAGLAISRLGKKRGALRR